MIRTYNVNRTCVDKPSKDETSVYVMNGTIATTCFVILVVSELISF